MSDEITPALTPEEWRQQIAHEVQFSRTQGFGEIAAHVYVTLADVTDGGPEANGEAEAVEIHWKTTERSAQLWDRQKLAALCLYGQPFGFTHEHVTALQEAPDWIEYIEDGLCPKCHATSGGFKMSCPPICTSCGWKSRIHPQSMLECFREIADRIAALLPPQP